MTMENEKPEEEVREEEQQPQPVIDPALLEIINLAMAKVEERLSNRLDATIASINQSVETTSKAVDNIQNQTAQALQAAPAMIKEHVEGQLQSNLKAIVQEINATFEEKAKAFMSKQGGGNGAGGSGIGDLLSQSDKIIGIVNAFRSPTTEQAMLGQMSFVMKWHQILSKLEKGGGSPDDLTKSITETFTPPESEPGGP